MHGQTGICCFFHTPANGQKNACGLAFPRKFPTLPLKPVRTLQTLKESHEQESQTGS